MSAFFVQSLGATAIEYALVAGLISIAIVGALGSLSGALDALFATLASAMP